MYYPTLCITILYNCTRGDPVPIKEARQLSAPKEKYVLEPSLIKKLSFLSLLLSPLSAAHLATQTTPGCSWPPSPSLPHSLHLVGVPEERVLGYISTSH